MLTDIETKPIRQAHNAVTAILFELFWLRQDVMLVESGHFGVQTDAGHSTITHCFFSVLRYHDTDAEFHALGRPGVLQTNVLILT